MHKIAAFCFILLFSAASWADAEQRSIPGKKSIKVAPEVEVPVNIYGASRQRLILWLPSEHGVLAAEQTIAAQLAQFGYEVWVADLFSARFLPAIPISLGQIPPSDVAQLIAAAARRHAKIYLLSSGQGAGRALEGAQAWQQGQARRTLAGAVLLFPNLHAASPEPGEAPPYLPIASQTRLPLAVLQGELSPWYWQLDELKAQLERGGSRVAVMSFPGLRDRFYFREDALPREREAGLQLAADIDASIRSLPLINDRKPHETPAPQH